MRQIGNVDEPCVSVPVPPNGLAFSCRKRAGRSLQNAIDLAREAVTWNAVLGRLNQGIRVAVGYRSLNAAMYQ